jgi:amino acid adenylation domain-containing protein
MMTASEQIEEPREEIAIVGMAVRVPGANDLDAFWANLRDGVESIRPFTRDELRAAGVADDEAARPGYVAAGALLDEADGFDAAFFGFSRREAELMDPQHRVLLECCWTALEHAGYDPARYPGRIGVFGGVAPNTYHQNVLMARPDVLRMAGRYTTLISSEREYAVTRVAFKLDLTGPAISVNTACSTSGVALHLACQSVLAGESDMALVGGARVRAPLTAGYHYEEDGILSPDGHCRAFDEQARGTVVGSGVTAAVVKRLSDALRDGDTVHAIVKGTAINNDGAGKIGFTAPGIDGQAAAIAEALDMAEVGADTIGYVEAHGTGTFLGDPIEITALTSAFGRDTDRTGFCRIGSVKTNIGHLDAGAGLAGVIKTVLALQHRQLPPSLHFETPNSQIDFAGSPFVVNDALHDWPATGAPRRAGVSTFGLGGTNAHIVLEEAPDRPSTPSARPHHLLILSARSASALARATDDLGAHLAAHPDTDLGDVSHTLAIGRHAMTHRAVTVAGDTGEATAALREDGALRMITASVEGGTPSPVFMFPGGGAQYLGMGRDLYRTFDVFRQWIDRATDVLRRRLDADLRTIMWPDRDAVPLERPAHALPALVAVEVATARLLQSLGVRPTALIGHSAGEYAAACLAGVFPFEDALHLVTLRGELFEELPDGAMLSVPLPEAEIAELLGDDLSIAVINRPDLCIVSGAVAAIDRLEDTLAGSGVDSTRLHISVAAHSPMVEPILDRFEAYARTIGFSAPTIPVASNLTGTWITDDEATDPAYWVRHLRRTVRFVDGLSTLLDGPDRVAVEVGPGRTLSGLARQHPAKPPVVATIRHPNEQRADDAFMLEAVGRLWLAGADVDIAKLYDGEERRRVPLPTYPFERQGYWIAPGAPEPAQAQAPLAPAAAARVVEAPPTPEVHMGPEADPPSRRVRILAEVQRIFHELTGIEPADLDPHTTFLELGFDSLFMTQASGAVGARFELRISFRQLFEEAPTIDALAGHIDERLPADAFQPPPPAAAPAASPPPTAATTAADGEPTDAVERLIEQQLEIMRQQLAVLGRQDQPVDARPPTSPGLTEGAMVARSPDTAAPPVAPTDGDGEADGATPTHGPWRPIERTSDALGPKQRAHIDALAERLLARLPGSRARTQQSRARLADPRTVAGFRRAWKELVFPVVATRSRGSRIWDVDDNEFIDVAMGFGVNLFGHSPDHVIEAITEQITHGIEIGPQTPLAAEVADLIADLTGHERVAFCNTGSEAVLAAMRLARTVTGRTKIVTFSGDYHGLFDEVLVRGLGTAGARRSMPISPGVPRHMTQDMIVLEYGSDAALDEIRSHAHELAAVLVEPVQSRHPDLQPARFLQELRALTADAGVPLIFDEMITGFRSHPGGAQALFGVQADLATYGKVVGGGFPIGVVAGRSPYMDALDGGWWQYGDESVPEADVTWFAGTFVRHPVALAASRATLRHLIDQGPQLQTDLNARTTAFVQDLNAFLTERGAPMHIEHFSSLFLTKFAGAQQFSSLFYFHLRDHGIHVTEGRAAFLSTAHTDDDIAAVADAYRRSVVAMQDADLLPRDTVASGGGARASSDQLVPLTEAQQEIWLAAQLSDENSCAYNLSNTLRLRGPLDVDALRTALQRLVDRHDALRTTIDADGEHQRIAPSLTLDVASVDLSGLSAAARDERLEQLRAADVTTPFDLAHGPLVRASVLRLSDDDHLLFVTVHHIICDGWSASILFADLSKLYDAARGARVPPLDPPMQLPEYARWQHELRGSPRWDESARHWLTSLRAPLPYSALPIDHPRPARRTLAAERQTFDLDGALVTRLRAHSSAHGRTLFTTLLAGFQCLLQRVTRSDDVIMGVSIAGQTQFPGRDLVGHCINVLPLRATISADATFTAVGRQTHLAVLDAVEHQNVSYGALLKELQLRRDPSRPALVSVLFNMDSPFTGLEFGGLEAVPGSNPRRYENFDVFVNVVPAGDGLTVECTYNVDLYDAATIRRRLEEYELLLRGVADDPGSVVSDLPLLPDGERVVLERFNATGVDYPTDVTLVSLFDAQVAATPDAAALVADDGTTVTYADLDARANQLAWWLRGQNVSSDTLVGVFMHRGIDMVVALYAIIKAGGAYVPLDPDYPDDRLGFMIDEAAMPVVVTQDHLTDRLTGLVAAAGLDATITTITTVAAADGQPTDRPAAVAGPDDLAYVIYTSGSTGRPKGVANTHRGVCNMLLWMQDYFRITADDRVLLKIPFSFDVSVWEFFWPLQVGARLVIAVPDGHRDAGYLIDVIARHAITTIHFVPSMLRLFLDHERARGEEMPTLQRLTVIGEALTSDLRDRFFDRFTCELHNLYGPTEAAVHVTAWQCHPDDDPVVPIGRPIANTTIHILDPHGQPTPVGVPGELHIGGVQVARGYLHRPELTAERFIADPFSDDPAARLYKTGDLARWLPDGTIDCLGRLDFQVKLHGVRIELGEIEATLGTHPNIRDATVILHTATPTDQRLVAYVVTANGMTPATDELRAHLRERLPGPMIPSVFVSVDALPLTASGKVDRNALPEVDLTQRDATRDYVDPTTSLEKEIAAVWSEVLGIERVGARDDFFELGGHSLQAMRATTRLRTLFSVELPLTTFFEHPTVAEQADAVTDALATAEDDEELLAMISELQDESVGTERADRE